MEKQYDFSGWATRNNIKCSDGRTILRDAFKHNDGMTVPLVWNHQHNDAMNVLGHALLENREEGVYAYCVLNESEQGKNAKLLIEHGDVNALSIYANQLKQNGSHVMHGNIRELSLVLAGANPGAFIDAVIKHGEESDEEAVIYTDEEIDIYHADEDPKKSEEKTEDKSDDKKDDEETVADVFNSLSDKQKKVTLGLIGLALEKGKNNDADKTEGGKEEMKHNVFDKEGGKMMEGNTLTHSMQTAIFSDAKRCGSLKEAVLAHADETGEIEYAPKTQTYGINGTDYLFPEARLLNSPPEFIKRDTSWVSRVMHGVHHSPFSRIKSMFADITEDDARAKGYMKGNLKKEEVFGLLKRTTTPTTIYKKQKMDRDDMIDIVDFDVVAWLKTEMRMMLDEEIARAILIGDGRLNSSDDKINELNIRPIWKDEDLFTIKTTVEVSSDDTDSVKAKQFIRQIIKSRKDYKGSGNPVLFTTEDQLTDCLLIEDLNGRIIYDSLDKLKSVLRVSDIITVPVMENLTRITDEGDTLTLKGIIVNLKDYNVGADKGGAVNMFDDFDIDYNAQKYLIETRCSGALIKPYSAIVVEEKTIAG